MLVAHLKLGGELQREVLRVVRETPVPLTEMQLCNLTTNPSSPGTLETVNSMRRTGVSQKLSAALKNYGFQDSWGEAITVQ